MYVAQKAGAPTTPPCWPRRARRQIYACGPQRMLDGLEAASRTGPRTACAWSISLHPGALDPDKEHGFEVELRESGITLQVRNDQTLLDALRSANIDMSATAGKACAGPAKCPCSKAISTIATWC
jgi:hypothetical protein